jgi:hypothetical protein
MMDTPATPAELAVELAGALEAAGIPYAIGGAVAYGFWGAARGTQDLDLNVFLSAEQAAPAIDALITAGVKLDRDEVLRSTRERGDARGFAGDIPVDLFFLSIPLHRSAASRIVAVNLLGHTIRILSAEDLVILKMLFFRGKDLVDVERVLATQGHRLDRSYVRRWLVDCVGDEDARLAKWDALCAVLPAAS